MFSTIGEAVESVGNTVSAGGDLKPEHLFEMLSKVDMEFDPQTEQPTGMSFVMHAETAATLVPQMQEWERTQLSLLSRSGSSKRSERNGVLERIVEQWLTRSGERGFEVPFAQLLASEGYRVLQGPVHHPYEHGKDIVAIDPSGRLCAFQLKGGDIHLTDFEKIQGNSWHWPAPPSAILESSHRGGQRSQAPSRPAGLPLQYEIVSQPSMPPTVLWVCHCWRPLSRSIF